MDFDLEEPATGERFRAGEEDDLGHPADRIQNARVTCLSGI
jgi:hypothetical protein